MNFLAFSDLHDDEHAYGKLVGLSKNADYTLVCGDTTHSEQFAEKVISELKNPLIIPGNWDNERAHSVFSKIWIHEKRIEIGELNIVGFGLTPPTPFGTFGEISEEEYYKRVAMLPIDGSTILLAHAPPQGIFDKIRGNHIGSMSLRKIIEEKHPLAVLCGHVHEYEGLARINETLVVKLPAAEDMRAAKLSYYDKKLDVQFITL